MKVLDRGFARWSLRNDTRYINALISFISNVSSASSSNPPNPSVPGTRFIGQLCPRVTFRKKPTRMPSVVYLLIRLWLCNVRSVTDGKQIFFVIHGRRTIGKRYVKFFLSHRVDKVACCGHSLMMDFTVVYTAPFVTCKSRPDTRHSYSFKNAVNKISVTLGHYGQWLAVLDMHFNELEHDKYSVTDDEVKWAVYFN